MKRKLIKIINKIIFHFLFWSVILAQRGTISVIITGLIRCLLYSFLSSSPLLTFLFSFLLCLILNLNGFIKCLGPNFGTLQSWQENRHILMLQKYLYYKPRSQPAQTLHTLSLLHCIIPWRGHLFQKQEFMHGLGRWEPCVYCLQSAMIWSLGPTLSILIIIVWKHSTALECSSVDTAQSHEMPYLSWAFTLRRRMAKVDKYLRSDHLQLQGAGGRVLIIRGGSQELSYQHKSGLHRFQRTLSDVIENQIKAIQPQINRINLLNWCLFLSSSQTESAKHRVITRWKVVKDNLAATLNNS